MDKSMTSDKLQPKKEALTFLGRCTKLDNRDGYYKGYNRNKVVSKFTNTKTETRNPSTCHFHFEHQQVCYLGKQTKDKQSD